MIGMNAGPQSFSVIQDTNKKRSGSFFQIVNFKTIGVTMASR